jgi:hypothetical protein
MLRSSFKAQTRVAMRIQIFLCSLALVLPIAPASAQERIMTIFGEDKCPADTICVRAPENDRYRIPKELRQPLKSPDSQSWAVRSQATLNEGKSGAESCSASGPNGWTGCWSEQMRKARAEAKEAAAAKANAK